MRFSRSLGRLLGTVEGWKPAAFLPYNVTRSLSAWLGFIYLGEEKHYVNCRNHFSIIVLFNQDRQHFLTMII